MIDHGNKCDGQPCTCGAKQKQTKPQALCYVRHEVAPGIHTDIPHTH